MTIKEELELAQQIREDWDSGINIAVLAIKYDTATSEIARFLCISEGVDYDPNRGEEDWA